MPPWSEPDHASPADLAACRALIRAGSRTFHAASLLLPARVGDPACALYAFCRLADDAVDLDPGAGTPALDELHERLERLYAGRPLALSADRALADVARRHAVPITLPRALLEGFAWDAAGRRYESLSELVAYAARVAGSVGAMMALLMGVRESTALARACDLGVAMQLTNIARDVGEDARRGRVYLPRQWLREAGIDPEAWLAAPVASPALARVLRRLLDVADALYERAEGGIALLPASCRPGIFAARLLYAEIGREVERQGLDPFGPRAVVPPWRKLQLAARAVGAAATARPGSDAPALDETRFLVDAVAASPPTATAPMQPGIWVLALFERLERRARLGGTELGAGNSAG